MFKREGIIGRLAISLSVVIALIVGTMVSGALAQSKPGSTGGIDGNQCTTPNCR
jgi:hypothetical protein